MRANVFFLAVIFFTMACQQNQPKVFDRKDYANYPTYEGNDLGLVYSPKKSVFKVWSPVADKMQIKLYGQPLAGEAELVKQMKQNNGVWEVVFDTDLKGKYYVFQVFMDGKWLDEVPDPYAKAVGTNGKRAQVIDLKETNPKGWEQDKGITLKSKTDVVLYELHVRDFSIHENSGMKNKGKYLAFTESGTTTREGIKTGIDHIKELGATHVHLIPVFDNYSIDESKLEQPQFNWGYDPQNYNAPEGSYSTDPGDGAVRIKEFKQMVKALHDNGLSVVMDVVYNHTGKTMESNFNQLVPFYYYRQNQEGGFSNGSWCGNETASERAMMRKFMIESLVYWTEEYHIDGFRFDLMGNHDIETMNLISKELHRINPSVFLYGEGWGGDPNTMPDSLRAVKINAAQLDKIAVFSDDMRDGLKGHVFDEKKTGFVSGSDSQEESIKFGIVASTHHPEVDYNKVFYAKAPFAKEPYHTINYCSAHDNHTLWDKLEISKPDVTESERLKMHKLANTIVLTSQGVPFLHAGVEFLRTKYHDHNSYQSPDSINWLDWERKEKNIEVFNYYKQLVFLRKEHPAFRMPSAEMIKKHLQFEKSEDHVVAFQIIGNANEDKWKNIFLAFNGGTESKKLSLPAGKWDVVLKDGAFVKQGNVAGVVGLNSYSALILKQE